MLSKINPKLRRFIADTAEKLEAHVPGWRADDNFGVMFARDLENIRAGFYTVPIPEFKGRRLLPMDYSVPAGAETDTYTWYNSTGKAEYTRDFTTTPPRVDVFGGQVTHDLYHIWLSYAWNIQEMRAAAMAGKPLQTQKRDACREGMEALIDEGLLLGDTTGGARFKGLFTLANTATFTLPNGLGGGTTWTATHKTPRQILADMLAIPRQVYVDTNEIETIDTLVLPTVRYSYVNETLLGDGDNRTILQAFLASQSTVKSVESSPKLASNGAWSGMRGVGYRKSESVLKGIISLEVTQNAPQWVGLEAVTIAEARVGGVQCYRPKAVIYFDGV